MNRKTFWFFSLVFVAGAMLTSPAMLNAQFVYVANSGNNTVSAYRMGTFGNLTAIGSFPTGNRPHSVAVDPMNRFVYVANADSSSVSAYRIEPTGPPRLIGFFATFPQTDPLSVAVDPTGRFVYVTGIVLGDGGSLHGSVSAFSIGPTGALTRIGEPVRADHFFSAVVVDPTGRFVYVAGRHGVSAFRIEATGALTPIEELTLISDLSRVAVDPTGQFAYISVSDTHPFESRCFLAAYRIGATGALTQIGVVGACVIALAVDPTGRFVYGASRDGGNVWAFSIGPTGALTEVGSSENLSSTSVAVDPTGRFVYVPGCADTACNGGNVAAFRIGSSGALTPLATRPATGSLPVSIATTSCTAPLPTLPTSLPPVVTKTDLHLPFSTTFVNSVLPELVTLTGLIHTTTTVTRFHTTTTVTCPAVTVGAHVNLLGVSGVGPVSGRTYHAHGTVRAQGTLVTPGTFSFPATFRITAPHSIIPLNPVIPIRTSVTIDSQGVATQAQTTPPPDALWLCNDGSAPLRRVDTGGANMADLTTTACSGVAFDGTFLYVSNFTGDISKRTADGITVLASSSVAHDPGVCCAEDLAFDTKRGKIWRIDHSNAGSSIPSKLRRIDPGTLTQEAVFDLPLSVSGFGTDLGGIGLAYDPFRDLLYASFCHAGCSSFGSGIVLKIDPNTGTNLGTLFTSSVFATFGLGYDFKTDALWMSSFDSTLGFVVRHMTLAGAVLSTFSSGLVGDGLEFISGGSIP